MDKDELAELPMPKLAPTYCKNCKTNAPLGHFETNTHIFKMETSIHFKKNKMMIEALEGNDDKDDLEIKLGGI